MVTAITATELKIELAKNSKIRVLDVRRKTDFEKSPKTIAGAVWLDPDNVATWSKTLPTNEDLVLYCVKGGSVSQSVAATLQESNFRVRFLEGGILGWEETRS